MYYYLLLVHCLLFHKKKLCFAILKDVINLIPNIGFNIFFLGYNFLIKYENKFLYIKFCKMELISISESQLVNFFSNYGLLFAFNVLFFLLWLYFFRMSSTDLKTLRRILCECMLLKFLEKIIWDAKFGIKRSTGGVNRIKHHLVETYHAIEPSTKVSKDVRLERKEALTNLKEQKRKEMNCFKILIWVQIQCMIVPCLK